MAFALPSFEPLLEGSSLLDEFLDDRLFDPPPGGPHEPPHGTTPDFSDHVVSPHVTPSHAAPASALLAKLKFGSPAPAPAHIDPPAALLAQLQASSIDEFNRSLPARVSVVLPPCSRVETQIKVPLRIHAAGLPPLLHLPTDLILKPKFCLSQPLLPALQHQTLFLETYVLTLKLQPCTICPRCTTREQKRASRRKTAAATDATDWADGVQRRAIIFNCKQTVEMVHEPGSALIELSARIVCYCRHHDENTGFRLLFVFSRHDGSPVAHTLSLPIMIMDRKKQGTDSGSPNAISPTSMDEWSSEAVSERLLKRRRDESHLYLNLQSLRGRASVSSVDPLDPFSSRQSTSSMDGSPSGHAVAPELLVAQLDPKAPTIQRVIPAQGPIRGGIEVTLLGCNFRPNLVVRFGNTPALALHCWLESTMVTYLPPAASAGPVLVSFEGIDGVLLLENSPPVFTYTDDTDRQLIELALQIVGLKMNGKLEDARHIAKRIVASGEGSNHPTPPVREDSPEQSFWTAQLAELSNARVPTPDIILRFLELNDTEGTIRPNLNLCTPEGHTMLHLAAIKGYTQLAAALLRRGCRVDARDTQQLTPLYYAHVLENEAFMKLLLQHGARSSLHLATGEWSVAPAMVRSLSSDLLASLGVARRVESSEDDTAESADDEGADSADDEGTDTEETRVPDALPTYEEIFPGDELHPHTAKAGEPTSAPAPAPIPERKLLLADKMLFLFWVPVLMVILMAVVLRQMNVEVWTVKQARGMSEWVLRRVLGSVMLGRERVTGVFTAGSEPAVATT